jgi:adenylate cyclase
MALKDEVTAAVNDILAATWSAQDATVVPKTDDVVLKNGAKLLDATYVYADMADSTGLAQGYDKATVAKVIRTYLSAASRILKNRGGEIRSFDGDRVMAIFVGDSKCTDAIDAALKVTWAVNDVIKPALKKKWPSFSWVISHGIGIDTGQAMIVRGGVRGSNDLVSVGRAPNIAAKLSEKRQKRINITSTVYNKMNSSAKYGGSDKRNMWTSMGNVTYGSNTVSFYGSSWQRSP